MTHTKEPWKYEEETKTIRANPSNHWLASMDSFDGAVDHQANARRIVACVNACEGINPEAVPELVEALEAVPNAHNTSNAELKRAGMTANREPIYVSRARAVLAKAKGET